MVESFFKVSFLISDHVSSKYFLTADLQWFMCIVSSTMVLGNPDGGFFIWNCFNADICFDALLIDVFLDQISKKIVFRRSSGTSPFINITSPLPLQYVPFFQRLLLFLLLLSPFFCKPGQVGLTDRSQFFGLHLFEFYLKRNNQLVNYLPVFHSSSAYTCLIGRLCKNILIKLSYHSREDIDELANKLKVDFYLSY